MASSGGGTGGWVRRVGASGGGRAYRRRRPINYYGVLGLVVVVGIGSVALARYDYRHKPAKKTVAVSQPIKDASWFEAVGFDACGQRLPALAEESATQPKGYSVLKGGAVWVNPLTDAETGKHATLAAFVATYPGLTVTPDELVVPKQGHRASMTYRTGATCPSGTPDAGKKGAVQIAVWPSYLSLGAPRLLTDPAKLHFQESMLITIAFVPQGSVPSRPQEGIIRSMLGGATVATTTTTSTTTTTTPVTATTRR